jgi:APA family basic amino acid/polyamine antiporter
MWTCTALVVGNMIGSGIFLLPASLAVYGGISVVGWLVTTTGAVLIALVFSRLSRAMPQTGGPYAYTRFAFGDFAGFLVAWGYWISIWVSIAAIAVAFVSYLTVFWPALANRSALAATVALSTIWMLTWVNIRGVRQAGILQLVTTVLKLMPLVVIATIGLAFFNADHFTPFNRSGESAISAVTATVALTLWAFLGVESATVPAGEVKDAQRTIPRATILGVIIAAVVYVFGSVAVMGILAPSTLLTSTAPFADAAGTVWGSWAGYAVGAGAVISCFGALNGWILLQGQIPFAAARDGLFPTSLSRLSEYGTPKTALVVSSVLATLLISMNYTKGLVEQFTFIILLATLATLVPYIFSSMATLMSLVREGHPPTGRRAINAWIVGGLAFAYSLWAMAGSGQETVYWGFLLLMAGVPVYVWMTWRRNPERRD